jgi:lactobin A/cerein 7B family class IIb bacteriocin
MKNLNLAAYGVAEMNREDLKTVQGGWFPPILIPALVGLGLALIGVAIYAAGYNAGFKSGYNAGYSNGNR